MVIYFGGKWARDRSEPVPLDFYPNGREFAKRFHDEINIATKAVNILVGPIL